MKLMAERRATAPLRGSYCIRAALALSLIVATGAGVYGQDTPAARSHKLTEARTFLEQNKRDEAFAAAKEALIAARGDDQAAVDSLLIMARTGERASKLEQELGCYAQVAVLNWLTHASPEQQTYMHERVRAIIETLDRREGGLNDADVLRLSTTALDMLPGLNYEHGLDGPSWQFRLLVARAKAAEGLGGGARAKEDLRKAISFSCQDDLFLQRLEAVLQFERLCEMDKPPREAESELTLWGMESKGPADAFLCQVALCERALEARRSQARLRLRLAFLMCEGTKVQVSMLRELASKMAFHGPEAGLPDETVKALTDFARLGPAGPDGIRYTADDVAFPVKALGGSIGAEEAAAIRRMLDASSERSSGSVVRRVRLFVWSGRIEEGLREAQAAYSAAKRGRSAQMEAVQEFVFAAKGQTGIFLSPDPFAAFIAFGAAGRDGVVGTDDDLADPFAAYLSNDLKP